MFIRCTRWFKHVFALKNRNGQRLSAIPFTQRFKVISAAFIALWLVAQISEYSLRGTEHSLLLASMGASAVLLFGLPGSLWQNQRFSFGVICFQPLSDC